MADGYISQIKLPDNNTYLLKDTEKLPLTGGKLTGGLEIMGHIAGDGSTTTGHGLYGGGMYHNAYNNIILHGDASTGSSGIAFISDKVSSDGIITNRNAPSDRAFIQYHACGVTTATAEGTNPTLASGTEEAGRLVIGIGNDSGDRIILQAPGTTDIIHQMGANGYPIPHTTNTNGSVGGTTTPVYVEAGVIKAGTALKALAYKDSLTLKIGNKSLSVGTSEQEWTVHDILYSSSHNIGTDTSWDITEPGVYSVGSNGAFTGEQNPSSNGDQSAPYTYGHAFTIRAGNGGASQFYINHYASDSKHSSRGIRYRSGWNVINNPDANHWRSWATILDDKNFNLYAPTLTGTGASGTWGISITGNAATASAVAWENTGHPSTFPPSAHTHYELTTIGDKRDEDTTPNTYKNRIIFQGLKNNSTINSPYTDRYSYLVGLRGWSDSSGGDSHELAFNGNGIYRRQGATTDWENWLHLLDSGNTTAGANNTATLAWSTTYTIAKINDVDIKFTTMAMPSYAFTDLTAHPNTLSGYGITDAKIVSGIITLGSNTITPVTSVNGQTGATITITAADLGLHTPLSFVGVVAANSAYQPSDGTQGTPTIVGMQEYTPASGDVILDKDSLREYVFANDVWTLLGYTASQIYDSNNIAVGLAPEDVPTWISRVTQATDGSIQVERKTIGVLPIAHGGTGASSFSANAVIISTSPSAGETMTLTSRAYSDSTSAEALVSTSTNFVTERDIYFGLPRINNLHNYTSDSDIYAPTTSGEQYQLLVSNDTGNAPVWTIAATVQSEVSTTADVAAYTTLTLGNQINVTAAAAHSEGQIQLYSAATHAHIIKGASTNTLDYTHILPNSDGVLVQTSSAGAVGGPTQPVYVSADNTITALTYTSNRLYYSESDTSFAATNHYASATQIGLGTTTLPENNSDTLYVNGTTYFVGSVTHNGFAYFANGTTYYIDDTGDARLKNLGIGDAAVSASYALNIGGDTYINGTHFFGNGTTYFIDDDAIGFFPDLRADQIRLNGDQIGFYQTENAAGDLYGSIQGIKDYMHFVLSNGTTDTTPTFDFNGHLLPSNDQVGDLGSSTNRWGHLYVGTDDTYGDAYTPVYWNDGVPTEVTLVQQCAFTIKGSQSQSGVMLTHEAFTENSYVLQIVVTSGESNLNSPIRWASYSSGQLALFCLTPPSGDVSGYILVSRGDSITPESEDFTGVPRPPVDPPTPPPVDPPSPPTPEPEGE